MASAPKKMPTWLPLLFSFMDDVHRTRMSPNLGSVKGSWPEFHAQHGKPPKPKAKTDPIKAAENAFKKLTTASGDAEVDKDLLSQAVCAQLAHVTPEVRAKITSSLGGAAEEEGSSSTPQTGRKRSGGGGGKRSNHERLGEITEMYERAKNGLDALVASGGASEDVRSAFVPVDELYESVLEMFDDDDGQDDDCEDDDDGGEDEDTLVEEDSGDVDDDMIEE
jgi:hypothetical protein